MPKRPRAWIIKSRFSVGTGIYTLSDNLNLSIGKKAGYNNILISKIDIRIGWNKDINKVEFHHKKSPTLGTDSDFTLSYVTFLNF